MRCTNQLEAVGVFATGGAVGSVAFYPFGDEGMFFGQIVKVFLGQVGQPETPTLFAVKEFVGTEQFFNPFGRLRLTGDKAVFFFCGQDEVAAFSRLITPNNFWNIPRGCSRAATARLLPAIR
ncbi:hypothetical protein J4528_03275 [Neisseria subflava]|nr:hypothetical protein [Neisseria subflava]MCL9791372.1 hypothetical protein [Neisseria subflava]